MPSDTAQKHSTIRRYGTISAAISSIISSLLALLVTGIVLLSPGRAAVEVPDSPQVSKLLSEVKSQAFQLKEDASIMETFTRTTVTSDIQADALHEIREHVNAAGREFTKLEEAKKSASPWQRTAIERIQPLLQELAGNTERAIKYVNDNPRRLFLEQYKDYLEANADVSSDLASTISDFVNYGNHRRRLENLGSKLEVPTKR